MRDPALISAPLAEAGDRPNAAWSYRLTGGLALWLILKIAAAGLFLLHRTTEAWIVYFAWDPWLLFQILRPQAQGFGPVMTRFRTEKREVWLTLDDGPDPLTTPRVLDLLDRHQARATFFVIGARAERHPHLIVEILARGHSVGNHTQSHRCAAFWRFGPAALAEELDATNASVRRASGLTPRYFRPPVGIKNPFIHPALARRDMHLVAWSARGYDCVKNSGEAFRRITRQIAPGAILLLHEGREGSESMRTLEQVLGYLDESGYRAILPRHDQLCV